MLCIYSIRNAAGAAGWEVGDWLINYGAGFVRRGLTGQLILYLGRALPLPLPQITALVQIELYALLYWNVYALLRTVRWSLPMLAFLLSPATLAFPVLDPHGVRCNQSPRICGDCSGGL